MIKKGMSIREASELTGIKKSTLHKRIKKYKENFCDFKTREKFDALMEYNQKTMHIKGGKATQLALKGKKREKNKGE